MDWLRQILGVYKAPLGFNPRMFDAVKLWMQNPQRGGGGFRRRTFTERLLRGSVCRELRGDSRLMPGVAGGGVGSEPCDSAAHDGQPERADRGGRQGGNTEAKQTSLGGCGRTLRRNISLRRFRARGRLLTTANNANAPVAGVINMRWRRTYWRGEYPLGKAAEGLPWEGWGWPHLRADLGSRSWG